MAKGKCGDVIQEAARRQKISQARKKKMQQVGYLNSAETRAKISAAQRGKTASEETRKKLSILSKGRKLSPAHSKAFTDAAHLANRNIRNEQRYNWTGSAVGYFALQAWVGRAKGKPHACELCGTQKEQRYYWISRSGQRLRDLDDWMGVCIPCRRKQQVIIPWNKGKKTGHIPWNKGTKGLVVENSGSFRKGQVAHNKGKPMLSYRGDKHPHWKGGITEVNHTIRTSLAYKTWRRLVFERDRFACVLCGYRSTKKRDIRADHIQPFSLFPELRFSVENGRTLCRPCDGIHGWSYQRAKGAGARTVET